ncbi:M23 family metallopeptidase, partial [Bacteroidetes bacterium endosymbiont of Geopemphigus sp.]|uniref:M23 family metallopeptidase n=1 Tax=Bacteroidetes bacterium endosymbiont of Geopemphigus sp. TaxID=2047937 RepID=UPI002244DB77
INHQNGYNTSYAHMKAYKVKAGQKIKRGDIIGYIGSTGLSTGPHLHYEVIKEGIKVDPLGYFYNDLSPDEYKRIFTMAMKMNRSLD